MKLSKNEKTTAWLSGFDIGFKFSEDQRETLWAIVKKRFGPQKASRFTDLLEFNSKWTGWREQRDPKAHREMLNAMIRNFNQTKIYLEMLQHQNKKRQSFLSVPLTTYAEMIEFSAFGVPIGSDQTVFEINVSAWKYAAEILPSIRKLVGILKRALQLQESRGGRPRNPVASFISIVAEDYERIFGEKARNSGVFLRVIKELLLILGLPAKDPGRMIERALKQIQPHTTKPFQKIVSFV